MDECNECPYCGEKFKELDGFWDHINSLTCKLETLSTPAAVNDAPSPPPRSSNSTISQIEKNTVCLNYVPERVSAPVSSNEFHNGDGRSFDMDAMRIDLPSSSQSPPPGSQLTKPVTNGSLNGNLFSKMGFPTLAAEAPAFSRAPKWKCTLCNVEFEQKQAMIAHVRSAEHEARISINTTSEGDRSQPLVQPKPIVPVTSTNDANATNIVNSCIKEDELVFMIRQIVREELRSMFQSYLDDSKKPELSSPLPSSNVQTKNYDTNFIQIKGQSIRCEACNCSLSSLTNLSHHVEGKRHKTTVARLTAPTRFS